MPACDYLTSRRPDWQHSSAFSRVKIPKDYPVDSAPALRPYAQAWPRQHPCMLPRLRSYQISGIPSA